MCKDCKYIGKCKEVWGEEYMAVVGTHHCRKSWDEMVSEEEAD